mgnify:CR=1 FL=1
MYIGIDIHTIHTIINVKNKCMAYYNDVDAQIYSDGWPLEFSVTLFANFH